MQHEWNIQPDGVSPCRRCSTGENDHKIFERVDSLLSIPFWRSVRRHSQCRECKWWLEANADRLTRKRHPRTPGLMVRLGITWALVAFVIATIVTVSVLENCSDGAHAASPQVGDRWTLNFLKWQADTFEGRQSYGVAEVKAVTDQTIELAACGLTSHREQVVEDDCESYHLAMAPVPRREAPELLEQGAISNIRRRHSGILDVATLVLVGIAGLFLVHALSARRFLNAATARNTRTD